MMNKQVAYQGSSGAYSTLAAKRFFGDQPHLQLMGFNTFSETLSALQNKQVDYAILPVENSITGPIHEVLSLLPKNQFPMVGEIIQPIEHCLIGLHGTDLTQLKLIYSHPQALMQCSKFLASLGENVAQSYADTAMAAQKVSQDRDKTQAAIASQEAASIYGLDVLKTHIANQKDNYTRFIVLTHARHDPRS
jgi:chorismate mutase/prephenate dehydratase